MCETDNTLSCETLIGKKISIRGVNYIVLAACGKDILLLELKDDGAPCQYVVGHGVHQSGEEICWVYGDYYPIPLYSDSATALKNAVLTLIGVNWNPFPDRATVEKIRAEYTPGTKVELLYMKDKQAPPMGTTGVVRAVDDAGSILVDWSDGSSLSAIPSVDRVRKI